ncbi:MAG: hypothetical protein ABJC19_09600 [Gemmatimonadota bacterium]
MPGPYYHRETSLGRKSHTATSASAPPTTAGRLPGVPYLELAMDDEIVVPIPGRPRPTSRTSQFINYAFWLLYSLLFIRLLLVFVDASTWTGFVRFINTVTDPFYAPFKGIVASQAIEGTNNVVAVPILIAIVVYALLQLAIHKLLRMFAYRQIEV